MTVLFSVVTMVYSSNYWSCLQAGFAVKISGKCWVLSAVVALCVQQLMADEIVSAPPKVPPAYKTVLPNGLTLIVKENHRMPVAMVQVWYQVGAMDEPVGKSGLSHMLEHLMFKGTKQTKPGEYSQIIHDMGGQDNAATSNDFLLLCVCAIAQGQASIGAGSGSYAKLSVFKVRF